MKILLMSDIHANWYALQAIREDYDICVSLGDLVDYGIHPAQCIDWARQRCTHAVRGNHDHSAAQLVSVQGTNGFRWLTAITRKITLDSITQSQRRYLSQLPVTKSATIDGKRYLFVHATPRDPMDEYGVPELAFWEERLHGIDADIICVGHTHQPYQLRVGNKLVINPGSVGLPRDGDPRASYAIIENGQVEMKRVEYPVEELVKRLDSVPLPESARIMLRQIYRTGRLTPSLAIPTNESTGDVRVTG